MQSVPIALVTAATHRLRRADDQTVARLVDSITVVGLLHPIVVRSAKVPDRGITVDGYHLVSGANRLEACRRLGWETIPAIVTTLDELHCQLAEVDENLCGARLTPSERALFTRRRKEIYEAIHPETRHGQNQHTRSPQNEDSSDSAERFTRATAKATGVSEKVVQRDACRGEKIAEDALRDVKGTTLDRGAELDAMKTLPPEDQRRLAAEAKAGKAVSARAETTSAGPDVAQAVRWIAAKLITLSGDDGEMLQRHLHLARNVRIGRLVEAVARAEKAAARRQRTTRSATDARAVNDD